MTIVVLYDDKMSDHWVGLTRKLTDEEKQLMARRFNAAIDGTAEAHQEDGRTISFIEQDTTAPGCLELVNIW